jgi:mannonate dehydratase
LHAAGFDGFLIDDHVPAMIGDSDTWGDTSPEAYCSRGRAHAIGYLQGVLNGLQLD